MGHILNMTIQDGFQAQSKHRTKARPNLSYNHLNDPANWPDDDLFDVKTNVLT